MGISVKINEVDRTEYVDARSLIILDELTNRASSASFAFICNNIDLAPTAGQKVLIEEDTIKLFSGRILTKVEDFLPPNLLKYQIECVDNTRDLDRKLVIESYLDELAGDIIKDIISKYTTGFTTVHVIDGPTVIRISFDYIQVSEALTKIAETCGYQWYVDYNKDIYFFLKTDYPAPFQLDDGQEHYRELIINYDVSQLRNRVYVKSSKYETLDFTELFIGDGSTVIWTCKYQANPLPHPSLKLDGVVKTVGWDGPDDPNDYDFMLNATTKVLSLGTYQSTPADGDEIVVTYGADVPIIIRWDDQDSIDAVKIIEGGDGIFEYCIIDNKIDTKEWAIDIAKADLLQNANPVIQGTFTTNRSDIKSGQIITLNSTKRNINQAFLVQRVELVRVDVTLEELPEIHLKPSIIATVHLKPSPGDVHLKPVSGTWIIYYVYQVTIATKLKGLEDLLLQLLYQSSESLKRDTEAPGVPSGLTLTTGMGEITQAGLAWLKATWNANTEDDFSHYELKYKKTAYSDYGYVTTTITSYIWTGLEQNIAYEVYIRSVDIYGNRSNWSSQKTQVTATDTETPAQITGAVATALLAGIKVVWTKSMGTNIAGYIVEREESNDGTTWSGDWTEMVRLTSTTWLNLHLPYIKYYRYQIKAYTQAGVEGAASTPTANSIKPNKAGPDDIVARSITGDHIAVNTIMANNYEELRNTYVFNGDDSLDGDYPFELDFEIVSEMTMIQSIKLSFRISQFRAYAKSATEKAAVTSGPSSTSSSGGGGVVSSAAGGVVSSASGGGPTSGITTPYCTRDVINAATGVTGVGNEGASGMLPTSLTSLALVTDNHTHSVPSHTHTGGSHIHIGGTHTHNIQHTHSVPAHSHDINFGIFEDNTSPTIHYHIDNGTGYGGASGNFNSDQLDIDITGSISGTGFKRIKFESTARARIRAWIMCKIDITA